MRVVAASLVIILTLIVPLGSICYLTQLYTCPDTISSAMPASSLCYSCLALVHIQRFDFTGSEDWQLQCQTPGGQLTHFEVKGAGVSARLFIQYSYSSK